MFGISTVYIKLKHLRWIIVWILFFFICFSLGYPTLNRYNPTHIPQHPGLWVPDTDAYFEVVEREIPWKPVHRTKHRILIPYLAKPFYLLTKGRIGTWNPISFGLLVVNSLFTALSGCLLIHLTIAITTKPTVGLLSGLIFLLTFPVSNFHLSGMVDSGELFMLLMVAWLLFFNRWRLLPLLGVFGPLAKETFVPLGIASVFAWWVVLKKEKKNTQEQLYWAIAFSFIAVLVVLILRSYFSGDFVFPWHILWSEQGKNISFIESFFSIVSSKTFWYPFLWLFPLGVWAIKHIPSPWLVSSCFSTVMAFALGVYNNASFNTARPMFNCIGPLLCVSVSIFLTHLIEKGFTRQSQSSK